MATSPLPEPSGPELPRPSEFIDRQVEWEELVRRAQSPRPELITVVGRRRVGKSHLLSHFARASGGIYHQATRRTWREQLTELSRTIGAHFDDPALRRVSLASWEDLFEYLDQRSAQAPLVVVIDEFPYLVDSDPALPSVLQRIWDHRLQRTRIKVLLCGSYISAMQRLSGADQPLHGRRTGQLRIDPFTYLEAGEFVRSYPPTDRLRTYAVFGGLPGYLALLDPDESLEQNVARHVLDPAARLFDEGAHVFDVFLADAAVHYSVVEAIASGEKQWTGIGRRVGKQTSSLKRPIEWLQEMDVLRRVAPITEYPNPSPKRTLYDLADPFLVFWYRFVADIRARGLTRMVPPLEVWRDHVAPHMNDHMGPIFERACRDFVLRSRHSRLPFRAIQVGSWWSRDSTEEVDVIALGSKGEALIGECKWGTADAHDVWKLKRRADLVVRELRDVRQVTLASFTRHPLATQDQKLHEAEGIIHFTLDDLYQTDP